MTEEPSLEAMMMEITGTQKLVADLIKALEAVKDEVTSNQEETQDFVKAWKDEQTQRLEVLKARQQTITDNQQIILNTIKGVEPKGEEKTDKEKTEK